MIELEAIAAAATAERQAAEDRERAALLALETARSEAAASAARRLELVFALSQAEVLETAARERMGQARASAAATEREIEDRAAKAAEGDDGAAKAIARLQDTGGMQAAILRAHEAKVRELAAAREAAEAALAEHDAAAATKTGHDLEELLLAQAEHADVLLAALASTLVIITGTVAGRRELRPLERWSPGLLSLGDCSAAARDALFYHLAQVSPEARAALANTLGGSAIKPILGPARHAIDCWRTSGAFPRNPAPVAA